MSDGRRMATNIIASWGANLVKVLMQLLMLPIMARLLGPAEMGLYALAMPIISLVMPLADAGLANSLAREPESNHKVWSTAFWILQSIGIVLAIGIIGGSYLVAYTSNQPRLPSVVIALAIIFPLMASGVLPMAKMIQKGRLVAPAMIDMTSNIVGACLGVYCAYSGFGVWALVSQYVSVFVVRMSLLNITELYLPKFMFDFSGLASHLKLGGSVTASKVSEFAGRIAENSQVSRALGSVSLGSYGFATQVARFLSEAVGNSLWANLYYQALHAKQEELGDALIRMTRLLCHILVPASFLAAALAPTLLPVLLGEKWLLAGWPLAIFCLSSPFTIMSSLTSSVLYARGEAKIPLAIAICTAIARFAMILCLTGFGLFIACAAVGFVAVVQCFAGYMVTRKTIGFQVSNMLANISWPIVSSSAGFGVAITTALLQPGILGGALGIAAFCVVYLSSQLIFDRQLFLQDCGKLKMLLLRRKKTSHDVTTG